MNSKLIILIPHYNNLDQLYRSVASIQENITMDLLVVDDGSNTKPDLAELKSIFKNGEVYLELLVQNQGIEKVLNHGLRFVQQKNYTYIGRLDAGDYCLPNRFEKQLSYLENNPEVKLLGTWVEVVDENLKHLYDLKHPVSYELIQKEMYLNTVFVHPSVVFRTMLIDEVGFYPENFKSAEDYGYFFEIIKKFKAENYPEILLQYVIEPNSISSTRRKQQVASRIRIILHHFKFGLYPIYGLVRSCILYFISRESITVFKKMFFVKS